MRNDILTAENLEGVWALVPTPWDDNDRLDEDVLAHDVAYLCRSGVDGLYTTASSGEFYAMEFDEFCRLVDIFLEQVKDGDCGHQIGCGWSDTRGTLKRVSYAVERGAQSIQIIFPYYIKLSLDEALCFMEDVGRAAGDVPLIHYNTDHSKLTLEAEHYRRLKEKVPTLIGTKLTRGEPIWFSRVCHMVPDVSHFTGEYTFAADINGGARGIYSWLGTTNPKLATHWYRAARGGNWNEAMRIQHLVNRFKIEVKSKYQGTSDAAANKADAMVNTNIRCGLRVRRPYAACSDNEVEQARAWAKKHFPELLDV